MKIVTSAPNKIILCGEHFVVYGAPALAIPTDNRNRIILVSRSGEPKITLKSNLGKANFCQGQFNGTEEFRAFLPVISHALKDNKIDEAIEIEIIHSGAPKGMGSSSSLGAAVGLALFTYFRKKPRAENLFECGQLVDEITHGGRPSGIDARTISRGKPQKFQRSFQPAQFNFEDIEIELPKESSLIVVDTFKGEKGERETTGQLIEKFAKAHGIKKNPAELTDKERENLFAQYNSIYQEFLSHCQKNGEAKKLGNLFNKNHQLLLSVSTPEIEKAREIALKNGAFGAKLTGAGGKGGAVIVLAPKNKEQNIIKALEKKRYPSFSVKIAQEGAKIEYD